MTMFPLTYQGEGQFQTPRGFIKRADKELVIGETLRWEQVHERSMQSHRHFFATVADAWGMLPEEFALEYPNPETLRKRALIKTGFCTQKKIVCADNTEAIQACAFIQGVDTFALCDVSGRVVTIWQAESQSIKAMGAKRFQDSKEKVLTFISELIGADATQAGMAA